MMNIEGGYEITKEIKTKKKVYKYIYIQDFFFLIIYAAITFLLSPVVHTFLQVPFFIFSGIMALVLIFPSPCNPKRKMYISLILFLHRDKGIYGDNFKENEEGKKDGNE